MYLSNTLLKSFQFSTLATALALAGCGGGHNDTVLPKLTTGGLITVTNPNTATGTNANLASVKNVQLVSGSSQFLLATDTKISLTMYALDANNMGVADVPVSVQITDPNLTGIFSNTPKDLKTDSTGKASIELDVKSLTNEQRTYLKDNGVTINTTVGTVTASKVLKGVDSLSGVVNATAPKDLLMVSSLSALPLKVGTKFTVIAIPLDANNNIIPNTAIKFNLDNSVLTGVFSNGVQTVTTNERGEATLELEIKSLNDAQIEYLKTTGVKVSATATVNNLNSNTLVLKGTKEPTAQDAARISLMTDVNTLKATDGETVTITAQVKDANGAVITNAPVSLVALDNPVATGFSITSSSSNVMTDDKGEAKFTVKAGSLSANQKYYLQTSGLSYKAVVGGVNSSTLTLRTQQAVNANGVTNLMLTSSSSLQLAVGSKVQVTALAIDQNGAVVPNAMVSFKVPADSGLVNNTGAVIATNANGQAIVELELKSLTDAQKVALQNGITITAQSGVAAGTTKVVSASSQSAQQAYNLFVSKSKDTLRTGSDSLTLTIRVTDTKGGIKANAPVYLQILEDGIARGLSFDKNSNLVTDAQGVLTVNLLQSDVGLISRLDGEAKIAVVVNDGVNREERETLTIPITGTTIDNLFVSNRILDAQGSSTITGVMFDGTRRPIANTQVELLLNNNPLATPIRVTTDAQGKFSFTVSQATLGADINGKYPLSVKLFGTNQSGQAIQSTPITLTELEKANVSQTTLQVYDANGTLAVNKEILVNTLGRVEIVSPKDAAGTLLADGSVVYLSTNKGSINNQGTRVQGTVSGGKAVFYINSAIANTAQLSLEYNGNIVFTDNLTFVSKDVQKLILQLERTTLPTNGSTKVIATVRDSNDLPIKNAIVEFALVADASGGSLEKGYAVTDDNGIASVTYFSGRTPTANDAVQIQASVNAIQINGVQQALTTRPTPAVKTLTVQTNATYIGLGLSDKLRKDDRNIYYFYDGSVFVNNNIGQPAVNQPVSISIIPVHYYLGKYLILPAQNEVKDAQGNVTQPALPLRWGEQHYDDNGNAYPYPVVCSSEDLNNNGIMDSVTLTDMVNGNWLAGEDFNKNGKLDPINPATVLNASGAEVINGQTMNTDATGKLDFSIRYSKESAEWWDGIIKITTRVNGSEFAEYRALTLPVLKDDVVLDVNNPQRPNWVSPFGKQTVLSVPTPLKLDPQSNQYVIDRANHYPMTINGKPYCQ